MVSTIDVSDYTTPVSLPFGNFCVSFNQMRTYQRLKIQSRTGPLPGVTDIEHTTATFTKEKVVYIQNAHNSSFHYQMLNILFPSLLHYVCTKVSDIYFIVSSSQRFRTGNEGLKDSQVFKNLKSKQ